MIGRAVVRVRVQCQIGGRREGGPLDGRMAEGTDTKVIAMSQLNVFY